MADPEQLVRDFCAAMGEKDLERCKALLGE